MPETPKCCFGLVRGPILSLRGNFYDSGDPSVPTGCGECSDPMPECQEGEALTVHRNTTELCCPLYQCGESPLGSVRAMCEEAVALGKTLALGVSRYTVWV
jgi:hypothetical protein